MEQFLKDDEIIKIINDYFENKNTEYAVMIDGDWGSGKTTFVLNRLNSELKKLNLKTKKKLKFIYVSVYGLKDVKELDNRIYEEVIKEFLSKRFYKQYKNIENGVGSLYEIIRQFAKLPSIPKSSVRTLIEILQKRKQKNYILIFDDIERCEMQITELLGYINEFVEHKQMKTIIIANEKEILKKKMYTNNELKYLVAASKNLNIPIENNKSVNPYYTKREKESIANNNFDIENLNYRVEKIFGEDLLYSQIKEKLIGITIYYVPDLPKVIHVIIDKEISNCKVKEYLKENKNSLINIMQNRNHKNIRTLKVALRIIERILVLFISMDLSKYENRIIENCKKDIIFYTMFACIEYKDGNWEKVDKPEFFDISVENRISDVHNGFKFINDIIEKSYVDDENVKNVLISYLENKSGDENDFNDPMNILNCYWEMDDEEIEKNYLLLKEKLGKNLYKSTSYSKIIYLIMKLINIGFPKYYYDDIKNIMIKNLTNLNRIDEYNAFDEIGFSFNNKEEREKYEDMVNPIKKFIEKSEAIGSKNSINALINEKSGWGYNFSNYCIENKNNFLAKKEFFNLIDINNLLSCLKMSRTKDISDFRRCIYTIYNFRNIKDFFEKDLMKLNMFLNGLNSIDEDELESYDRSKKYNVNWLKNNVEELINRLNS